jgi:hypothetical protein
MGWCDAEHACVICCLHGACISPCACVQGLTEVGWRLHIESNAGLTNLQALQGVRRVGGYLKVNCTGVGLTREVNASTVNMGICTSGTVAVVAAQTITNSALLY